MARSPHNRQVNVPIPRKSEMEAFYEQEAAENGVRLPTHFYQLLKDRYEYLTGKHSNSAWFLVGKPGMPNNHQNHFEAVSQQEVAAVVTRSIEDVIGIFGDDEG